MINKNNIVAYINFLYHKKFDQEAPQDLLDSWSGLSDAEASIHLNGLYKHWNLDAISSKNFEQEFLGQRSPAASTPVMPGPPPKIDYPTHNTPMEQRNYSHVPPEPFNPASGKAKSSGSGVWIATIIGLLLIGGLAYYFLELEQQDTDVPPEVKVTDTAYTATPSQAVAEPATAVTLPQTEDDRINAKAIQDLLMAEQARNFEDIYQHFSPNMERYWNINYPTYDELRNRYEDNWSKTQNSEHSNIKIEKTGALTYDVSSTYAYFSLKDQKEKRSSSKVRFIFDADHKIIKTYGI